MKRIILLLAAAFFVRAAGAEEPAATIRTPSGAAWRLVWSDEFDYKGLPDPAKWDYDISGNDYGWGNNELQHYTAGRRRNVGVKDGLLTITARRESQGGKQYTSTRLVTRGRQTWQYGRVEARVRFPEGRGTWSAVWLMPAESRYGDWPASGEIDLVEQVGYDAECIVGTVHTTRHSHLDGTQKSGNVRSTDVTRDFHRYAIEWEADEIRFYFDERRHGPRELALRPAVLCDRQPRRRRQLGRSAGHRRPGLPPADGGRLCARLRKGGGRINPIPSGRTAPDFTIRRCFFTKCDLLFKEKSAMFAHILRTQRINFGGCNRTKHS